jgi:hypothetical protein
MTSRTDRTRTPRSGEYERDTAQAEIDAEAARLRSQGMSYRRIGAEQSVSPSTAMERVKRAIAAVPVEAVNELRLTAGEQLDMLTVQAFRILATKHPMVSHGHVVPDVEDIGPKLAALRELRMLNESRRKLFGMDMPIKVDHTVTTDMERQILALAEELGAVDPDTDDPDSP